MHGTSGSGNCKLRRRRIDKWSYNKISKSEGLAYDHSARIRFLDLKKPQGSIVVKTLSLRLVFEGIQ